MNTTQEQSIIDFNLIKPWLDYVDAKPRTAQTYRKNISYFFRYLQERGITKPTSEIVRAYRDELKPDHKPATVKAYLKSVQLFFKWAAMEGIYKNIANRIKLPEISKDFKKDYLTSEQAGRLLAKVDRSTLQGKRDYAILCLMLTTGLRTISVVNADVGDVATAGGENALYYLNKGGNEKTNFVKLPAPTLNAINAYLEARGNTSPEQPLFVSLSHRNQDARMTTRSVSRIAKDYLRAAGMDSPRLTAHSLRHTAATLNMLNGGSLEETQELLAHVSASTTMIYCHTADRSKNSSEQRISDAIFGNG